MRQIHDNIERLEYQLRNNNFKPREEQKILDEISMLRRSVRTLREFEAKQVRPMVLFLKQSLIVSDCFIGVSLNIFTIMFIMRYCYVNVKRSRYHIL